MDDLSPQDRRKLAQWCADLLDIRGSQDGAREKAIRALRVTRTDGALLTILKTSGITAKKLAWDDRSWAFRLLSAGVLAGLAVGEGAGIAALGGAIGVPLWIVLGAGGAFAGTLLSEFRRREEQEEG